MKIIHCEQGGSDWFAARCGIPSSSNFDKIVTMKGEPSKQRTKYMYQLAGETITGVKEETYQNAAMQRGSELEEDARELYQMISGDLVDQVGFCIDDKYGASPDGMIDPNGLLEIKCPSLAVHVEYLLGKKLPSTYFQQVQGQLLVTGREYCMFMSYYPGITPLIIRVDRNEIFLTKLKENLYLFCTELEQTITKLR